jgi:hypothetical protein
MQPKSRELPAFVNASVFRAPPARDLASTLQNNYR